MNRNAPILLAVCLLMGGCTTTPPPSAFEVWQSRLTEGQSLTIRAAVLAAEVFNETYDHTIKELKEDPALMAALRDKINEARRLYRKAKSWNLSAMPPRPEQPTRSAPSQWVLSAPNLPVEIDYEYAGSTSDKRFFGLKVVTLRGQTVMTWTEPTEPAWYKPFDSFVNGDRVDLDVPDLILGLKIDRE